MNEERIVIYEDDLNETIKLNEKIEQIEPKLETLAVTPTAEQQEFESELDGYSKVTVQGDENLKAENISKGISIFGVEGVANMTNAKITDASFLFYNGAREEYMNDFLKLCENVGNTHYMFFGCKNLTELDLSDFDTSNAIDMGYMFDGCKNISNLDLSNFDTKKSTSVKNMFNGCTNLRNLNISSFDTSNVTEMDRMFSSCINLTELALTNFNTSNVTRMDYMFYYCSGVVTLDLSSFDMSNVYNQTNMLGLMNNLTNLKSFKNLGKAYTSKTQNYSNYKLDLSKSTKLTHESLIDVINNLYDLNLTYNVANGGTLYRQSLVLGSTNLAKLTEDEIAIATNKGWNVS